MYAKMLRSWDSELDQMRESIKCEIRKVLQTTKTILGGRERWYENSKTFRSTVEVLVQYDHIYYKQKGVDGGQN